MSPLEVLRSPREFYTWLKTQPPRGAVPWGLLLAAIIAPNLVLLVTNFMQPNLLFVSIVVAAIFVGALLAFVTVLARGAEATRTLEVVAYSFVPFLLGLGVFGLLTVFGATGVVVGQGLLLGAVLIGWYRLYMGLEIMTGAPTKALLGAVLGPLAALLFTFLVPGLLLRLLGL